MDFGRYTIPPGEGRNRPETPPRYQPGTGPLRAPPSRERGISALLNGPIRVHSAILRWRCTHRSTRLVAILSARDPNGGRYMGRCSELAYVESTRRHICTAYRNLPKASKFHTRSEKYHPPARRNRRRLIGVRARIPGYVAIIPAEPPAWRIRLLGNPLGAVRGAVFLSARYASRLSRASPPASSSSSELRRTQAVASAKPNTHQPPPPAKADDADPLPPPTPESPALPRPTR